MTVMSEVNVAIKEVGGLEEFLKKADLWLEQELEAGGSGR